MQIACKSPYCLYDAFPSSQDISLGCGTEVLFQELLLVEPGPVEVESLYGLVAVMKYVRKWR